MAVNYFLSIDGYRVYYADECTCRPEEKYANGQPPHFYPADKQREALKKWRHYRKVRDSHFGTSTQAGCPDRAGCGCQLYGSVHFDGKHLVTIVEDLKLKLRSDVGPVSPGGQSS